VWERHIYKYVEREDELEDNRKALYSTVWMILSKVMKMKVTALENFAKKSKDQDPLWLLLSIRTITYKFDETKPLVLALDDALKAIIKYKQHENMDNSEFLKTFLSLIKVYEQYERTFGYNKAFANELEGKVKD